MLTLVGLMQTYKEPPVVPVVYSLRVRAEKKKPTTGAVGHSGHIRAAKTQSVHQCSHKSTCRRLELLLKHVQNTKHTTINPQSVPAELIEQFHYRRPHLERKQSEHRSIRSSQEKRL